MAATRASLAALIAVKPHVPARLIDRVHRNRARGKDWRKGLPGRTMPGSLTRPPAARQPLSAGLVTPALKTG